MADYTRTSIIYSRKIIRTSQASSSSRVGQKFKTHRNEFVLPLPLDKGNRKFQFVNIEEITELSYKPNIQSVNHHSYRNLKSNTTEIGLIFCKSV